VCSEIEINFFSGACLSRFLTFGNLPEDGGNSSIPNDMISKDGQNEKFCLRLLPRDIITTLYKVQVIFNPLNAELNPICHLLALLGAHHIFHVSVLRVNACRRFIVVSHQ
jgi:hypothetical protein